MLPDSIDDQTYWKDVYHLPPAYWQPALEAIAQRHQLAGEGWQRARLGRNVVFTNPHYAIKLGPPFWPGSMAREAFALEWIAGRLPVQTPEVIASGELSGWEYLIQRRLDGRNLWELWKELSEAQREVLAVQHGELLAVLHALPASALGEDSPLRFDWPEMVAVQRRECAPAMRSAGFAPALVEQVAPYLGKAAAGLDSSEPPVLLHGDLVHLNFLVHPRADHWQITALIDWGDVKVGPVGHEFISPAVNMYKGDQAAIAAFYRGCGSYAYPLRNRQEVMARAMLDYSGELLALFNNIPAAAACADWDCLSRVLF